MIAQGTDGVSQGNKEEGAMRRGNMMHWAPWEKEFLKPEGWFERSHELTGKSTSDNGLLYPHMAQGVYVWKPAPAPATVPID
eukprot:14257643-Ditylum_brightwellii.AAC.1